MNFEGGRREQVALAGKVALAGIAGLAQSASAAEPRSSPWSLSTFLDAIDQDLVEKVSFAADGKQVLCIDKDGNRHEALLLPRETADLIKKLSAKGITFG